MEDTDSDDSSTQSDESYKTAFEEIDIYDDDNNSFYVFITKDGTVWLLPITLNFSSSSEKNVNNKGEYLNHQYILE